LTGIENLCYTFGIQIQKGDLNGLLTQQLEKARRNYLHTNGKDVYFSKEIKEGALDAVPDGYQVVEMKTGMLRFEAGLSHPRRRLPKAKQLNKV